MAEETPSAALQPQIVTIHGREITIQPLVTLGLDKLRLFARIGLRMQQGKGNFDDLLRMDRLLAQLMSDEDNNWLEDQVAEGTLTTEQILDHLQPAFEQYTENVKQEQAERKKTGKAQRG